MYIKLLMTIYKEKIHKSIHLFFFIVEIVICTSSYKNFVQIYDSRIYSKFKSIKDI